MYKRKSESENGSSESARKRADVAKYFLASIVESSKDSIVTVDFDSNITSWNKAAEHLYGYPAEETVGKPLTMLTLPENLKQTLANTKKIKNGEAVELFETVRLNKNGRQLHLEIVLSPVKDEAGQIIGVSTIARDITDRWHAEEALREKEARLAIELADAQQLQSISNLLIEEENIDALYEQILESAIALMRSDMGSLQVLDAERKELQLLAWKGFHPDAAAFWKKVSTMTDSICGAALSTGGRLIIPDLKTSEFLKDSESRKYYELSGIKAVQSTPLISRDGRVVGMVSTHWRARHTPGERELKMLDVLARQTADLIERKRDQDALRKSEERFRAMFEQASVGIVMKTIEGQLMNPSPGFCQIIGYTREETVQLSLRDITHPDDYKNEVKLTRRLIEGKIPGFSIEKRYVRKDGSLIWGNLTASLVRQMTGEPFYMLAIVEDIHERKEFEEALRKSQERLRLLIESASDYAIFTMTPDNRIDSWNTGAEKVFRWTESEALGQSGEIIFTPEDRAAGVPEQEINTALENGRAPDERYHIRRDGSRFYASGVTTLLKDADGKIQGFAKICRDMTEQIEAGKAIRHKEMLQILVRAQEDERTRIARDLHDELGQQLTALRLKLDALRKMCDIQELCDVIDETQLIAKSIDNGVDFLAWELRPASLDDLGLVAALDNYVREWSHNSGVTAELLTTSLKKERFTPEVETNLYRIVQEALNNTHKHAKAKYVEVMLDKRGETIGLLISDDGKGFSQQDKKNRLKGLGLTGMKERAALVGGTLEIESAKGKGTTIFVRIPAASMKRRRANEK